MDCAHSFIDIKTAESDLIILWVYIEMTVVPFDMG